MAPWLTLGSLRSYESALALHALQPALSRHWRCPGCRQQLLATHQQVLQHVACCAAALALPREVIERCGYEPGGRGQAQEQEQQQQQGEQGAGAAAGDGPGDGDGDGGGAAAAAGADSSAQEGQEAQAAAVATAPAAGSGSHQQPAFTWAGLCRLVAALTEKQGRVKWGRRVAAAGSKGKDAAAWAQLGLARPGAGAQGYGEAQEPGQSQQLQLDVQQVLEGVFAAGPQEQPEAGAGPGPGPAPGDGEQGGPARQEFECSVCGLRALLTSVEVLQHRRSHA